MNHRALDCAPLASVVLAHYDHVGRDAKSAYYPHQPSGLGKSIIDIGLNHKEIQVASIVRLPADVRSEKDHTRRTAGLISEGLPSLLDGRL